MAERRVNRKSALIIEEAAEWFVRLRDDNLGLYERRCYVRWLKKSPAHTAEILRMCRLADGLRDAKLGFVAHPRLS